jgi:isoleucyl-tRNA synthetase
MLIRDTLNQALESARNQKVIGRSMEASISIYHHNPAIQSELEAQKELYRQVFIVAELTVCKEKPTQGILATAGEQIVAAVQVAEGQKCERCWIIHPSVGQHVEHPGLCERCATIVSELT